MRHLALSFLLILPWYGNSALAQQAPASSQPTTSNDQDKPRIFVTDSNSWSMQSAAGGSNSSFGASSSGGARPQTAEIIKTFGQRCPEVIVNNRADASNYIVELDHEGGKGLLRHKDKIAVFVQKSGDSIFSESTLSVGGSVKDACAALLAHWGAHASEFKVAPTGYGQGGFGEKAYGSAPVVSAPTVPTSGMTVEANVPNCDIEVDGNFMGSTPSTLNLAPGKHEIVIKKTGYRDWKRSMLVGSGEVRLSAEMLAN
jgi:hypothetical protein